MVANSLRRGFDFTRVHAAEEAEIAVCRMRAGRVCSKGDIVKAAEDQAIVGGGVVQRQIQRDVVRRIAGCKLEALGNGETTAVDAGKGEVAALYGDSGLGIQNDRTVDDDGAAATAKRIDGGLHGAERICLCAVAAAAGFDVDGVGKRRDRKEQTEQAE